MSNTLTLRTLVRKSEERRYLPVRFEVPEGIERLDIRYTYPRMSAREEAGFTLLQEESCIDLAVFSPGGDLVGASGSNRDHVWISVLDSSEGFDRRPICAGAWEIVLGAYRVPEQGVEVVYDITLTEKRRRLFRGDTHSHTTASDGRGSAADSLALARQLGLDFLFVTDHNSYAQNDALPRPADITLLPGCEWTHYKGHAGMLGIARPFTDRYCTESLPETQALLRQAQERGAFVVLNHPFCPLVPWEWGFELPFDGVEVWNGVMSERNMRAIGWWHMQLCQGARLPITGGSDYHAPGLLGSLAMPCHYVYAPSREPNDLLAAIRAGHGFISYLPEGPVLDIACEATPGEVLGEVLPTASTLDFYFSRLQGGDVIRLLTAQAAEEIVCPPQASELHLNRSFRDAPFVRVEIDRVYAPGLPPMKALVSNPVYFR